MPPRKELCRNFQRGSCQFGDRCKFLHAAAPQQQKTSPFGFGVQTGNLFQQTTQQQQSPNPFGFGVQNKPFENKWTRPSATEANNAAASRQPEAQRQATTHKCTDPESCRRVIMEDLENEKPIWKLTCYGHKRDGPCDITGDISYEELRALAYDDARSGKSLQSIIERERNLVNTKLAEFQNLIQKPSFPSNTTINSQSPFAGNQSSAPTVNNNFPPAVSSFGQLNASLNTSASAAPNYSFGQSSVVQNNPQPPTMFQTNHFLFNTSGTSNSQMSQQKSPFSFGSATTATAQRNPFSTSGNTPLFGNANDKQINFGKDSLLSASSAATPTTNNSTNEGPKQVLVDDSIWSKPEWKWNSGEIPEEAPPDFYIY